ncbi:MAG: 8-oxo-dGTP diphosphatase MutT [Woeseia sp.]
MSRAPQLTDAAHAATRIGVAAGILRDKMGRILLAERRGDASFPGLWEFPGGKIGAAESVEAALLRELREELGIEISAFKHLLSVDHDYGDRCVRLYFYMVTGWRGELRGVLGQHLRWVSLNEMDATELLPADVAVIDALRRL